MQRILRTVLSVVVVLCLAQDCVAQYTKAYAPWPVVVGGDTLELPFWGGVNSPKPSLVDFDGDGLTDLMIGESRGKVAYLRNAGTASTPLWTPISERIGGVNTRTWHRFCDIDNDGDLDLFCEADSGLGTTAYYRNESVGDDIVFTLIKYRFGDFETGVNNTGDFADLDNDGDYDFFLGSVTGELWQYRNDGDSTDPIYVVGSLFYDSVFAFPGGIANGAKEPQHGFSTITFCDHDSDGDGDLFWGDINNNNAYLFSNLGTPTISDLTETSESYLPLSTFGLNHTAFADLDDDGDVEVIMGAANGNDINNLILMRNIGTPFFPSYAVEDTNMIHGIDVGSYAIPALGDLDGDGDSDLLIGRGDGRISHYENMGSESVPSFNGTSDFYKSIDVGLSAAPALVDWDNDGDLDLLIGSETGRIAHWRNDGSAVNFDPVFVTNQLGSIQVDILAVPVPVDWDNDGLTDLIVGEWDFNGFANILLYENVGTPGVPSLSLVTNRILKRQPRDFTIPTVYDWDCDGRKDLIVGGRTFGSDLYLNTAGSGTFPDSLTLILQSDTLPWTDDGYRLSVALADMNGDHLLDAFVGEEDGGVNFYARDAASCSCPFHGDPSGDGAQSVTDVVLTVNAAFRGLLSTAEEECCPHISRVDHNCDCVISVVDVVLIVNTAFRGGPPSCDPCAPGNQCPE
jgi:hypothetical protein